MKRSETKRHHRKRRLALLACLLIAVTLLTVRALAPIWVRNYVERTLDQLEGHDSDIVDVDLFLWRGAYTIEGLSIVKIDGDVPVPFISVDEVDLSIQWTELFDGALVGEMIFRRPTLNFVAGPTEEQQQTGAESSWVAQAKELFPFRLNRLQVQDGTVHFRNFHSDPKVDVHLDQLNGTASNLTNSDQLSESLTAHLEASARVENEGEAVLAMELDPYAEKPTFKGAFELKTLPLTEINDLLRAYANVDAERGTFAFYAELASDQGRYQGYVKPILEDVEILLWREESEGFWRKVWEGVVEVAANVLENQSKDRVASQVPIEGTFENPDVDVLAAIGWLLRNAFIQAIDHGIEGTLGGAFDFGGDTPAETEQNESQPPS